MAGSVRQATYNKPGLLTVASGTASTGGSLAIQQETGEGWTGIFVDFEPYTGWGLWHDNGNNFFSFTSEVTAGNIRSFAVPSRVSGNRTAYEKFRVDQNNGDTIAGGIGYANASFRAPIFYDSNNTAFYIDPASSSIVNNLTVSGTLTYSGTLSVEGAEVLTVDLNTSAGNQGWDLHGNRAMQAIYGNHNPLNNGNVYNAALFRGGSWTMYGFNGSSWVNLGSVAGLTSGYGKANWGSTTLSRSYSQFIIDCGASFGYTFMSALTLTHSTNGNSMDVYFEKSTSATYNSGTWSSMAQATGQGSWPGGTSIKFSDVVGGGYPAYVRLRIIPSWNAAYPSNTISLGQLFVSAAYGGGNQLLEWDTNYNVTANGSFRSPIFYDSNDTTYFVDPASGSRLSRFLTINGGRTGIYGNELVVGNTAVNYSLEDSNQRPIIQAHGAYPVLSLNHTVTSNGSHGPTVQFTANGTGNQFVIGMNGSGTRLDIGTATGNSWNPHNGIDNYLGITGWRMDTSGNVNHLISTRSPIYYDYNNTAYYTDQAGTSNYFNLQITGASNKYLYLNPGNGYEAMVRYNGGSGSGWYVGKRTASQVVGTESFHFYSEAAGQTVGGIDTSGNIFARDSVRAPIFYDSANTGYYVDPASTSNLGGLTLACNVATGRSTYGRANANLVLLADSTYGAACIDFRSGVNYPSDGAQIYYETATNGVSGETSRLVIRTENDADDSILLRGGYIQLQTITVDGGSSSPGLRVTYNSTDRLYVYSDNTTEQGSFRAPIFYDSNDTGYYVDPNGTTVLSTLYHNAGTAYFRGGTGIDQCCGDNGAVSIGGNSSKPPRIAWHSGGIMEGTMEGSGTGWRKIYFYDQQGAGLGVHATGQIASNVEVVAYYSDRRLKEDLERVTDHWNVINNITGYRYTWNEKSGEIPGFIEKVGKREVGLIAQDVLAVYPEAVYTRQEGPTDDPYKTIMHDRFSAVFIEALKDLKKEVDQLKQENKELRDMLNARPASN
jgi:hypothetical protein